MSRAKEAADRAFSLYIRRRDCPQGIGRCFTCGRKIYFADCDAGHYIPRRHSATRWNEFNVNAQCRACNRMKDGNVEAYRSALLERYGMQVVEGLERLKNRVVHLTDADYRELAAYYAARAAELK